MQLAFADHPPYSAGNTFIIQGFVGFLRGFQMPIYAYRCDTCGFTKDVLQKISDAPLTACPSCDKASFKKQLTAAGFQLKGSGWYVTDFRGGSSGASAPAAPAGDKAAASAPSDAGATTTTAAPSTSGTPTAT
jgi:putative FmdB family regulatory protein